MSSPNTVNDKKYWTEGDSRLHQNPILESKHIKSSLSGFSLCKSPLGLLEPPSKNCCPSCLSVVLVQNTPSISRISTELASSVEIWKNQILHYEKENQQLKSTEQNLRTENVQLSNDQQHFLAKCNDLERRCRSLQSALNQEQQRSAQLETRLEDQKINFQKEKASYENKIEALVKLQQATSKESQTRENSFENQASRERQEYEAHLHMILSELNQKIETQEAEHKDEIKQMRTQMDVMVKDMQRAYQRELHDREADLHMRIDNSKAKAYAMRREMETEHRLEIDAINNARTAEIAKDKDAAAEVKAAYEQEMASLKALRSHLENQQADLAKSRMELDAERERAKSWNATPPKVAASNWRETPSINWLRRTVGLEDFEDLHATYSATLADLEKETTENQKAQKALAESSRWKNRLKLIVQDRIDMSFPGEELKLEAALKDWLKESQAAMAT